MGEGVEELRVSLEIVGIATEVLLLGLVSMRRAARNVPTFLVYLYWAVLSDLLGAMFYYKGWSGYLKFYDVQATIEELLLIAILFDLARSALCSLSTTVARLVMALLGLATASASAVIWRASDRWTLLSHYAGWHVLLRLQLTSSLLRILLLLLIGGLVEFLSRHYIRVAWGEPEMHIATGMGIYALADLAESLATTYQRLLTSAMYPRVAACVTVTYELCMIYWIVSFFRLNRGVAEQAEEPAGGQFGAGPTSLWQKGIAGVLEGRTIGKVAKPRRV